VPGLSAKDVIYVQVTVAILALDRLAPALERAGFPPTSPTTPDAIIGYLALKGWIRIGGWRRSIDSSLYADLKNPACDIIMAAAEEWSVRTGWLSDA
jgi:hypothetical protein